MENLIKYMNTLQRTSCTSYLEISMVLELGQVEWVADSVSVAQQHNNPPRQIYHQ